MIGCVLLLVMLCVVCCWEMKKKTKRKRKKEHSAGLAVIQRHCLLKSIYLKVLVKKNLFVTTSLKII